MMTASAESPSPLPPRVTPVPRINGVYARLTEEHRTHLRKLGISEEIAITSCRSVVSKSELRQLGFSYKQIGKGTGILFTHYGVNGKIVGYEFRPDEPRTGPRGKVIKYEQPPGQRNHLDIHPSLSKQRIQRNEKAYLPGEPLTLEQPPIIRDPAIPLLITEGSKKALAAVSVGLACISISGVFGWRGKNGAGGATALSDWEDVALNGRRILLAFDNDVLTKRPVRKALNRLKKFLEGKDAKVQIILFPSERIKAC